MTTLRTKTREVVESARFGNVIYTVSAYGKPVVAIIGIDYFEMLQKALAQSGVDYSKCAK